MHDDLNLDPGVIRSRNAGNDGGHNGVRSVLSAFSSIEFRRVKIGVGRPAGEFDRPTHVLTPMPSDRLADDAQGLRRGRASGADDARASGGAARGGAGCPRPFREVPIRCATAPRATVLDTRSIERVTARRASCRSAPAAAAAP